VSYPNQEYTTHKVSHKAINFNCEWCAELLDKHFEWNQGVDNLFSANHRNAMLQQHNGTMAQIYTVEQILKEGR